jgi:hypothetical protein
LGRLGRLWWRRLIGFLEPMWGYKVIIEIEGQENVEEPHSNNNRKMDV